MKLIALALALLCGDVGAQTIMSGFHSKHSSGAFCEANPGIGYRQDSGPWSGWGIGVYKNSLCKPSAYVAREWRHPVGPVDVGLLGMVATGYNSPIIAAVLPEVVVSFGGVEVALLVQPFNVKFSPAFAAVQFRYSF